MDPIDRISRVMHTLRRRLAGRGAAIDRTAAGGAAATGGAALPGDVRDVITTRLRALDPDEPQFADRATEAFVEGVLLDEFGADMTNDAKFRQVILGVARELRSEPETAVELDQLFRILRRT